MSHELPTSERSASTPRPPSGLRLLPWTTPEGKPCYLSTDGHGPVSALADQIEAMQLATGEDVLRHARLMLADPKVPRGEFRFLSARLAEALQDALRVARSREGVGPGS